MKTKTIVIGNLICLIIIFMISLHYYISNQPKSNLQTLVYIKESKENQRAVKSIIKLFHSQRNIN